MGQPLVMIECAGSGIVAATLNRPEKRNALTIALIEELCAAVETASRDPQVRVLLLNGAGPVFCSGLDLGEASDENSQHESARCVARMLTTITESPLVTIAAARGAAVAGGAGLVAACDFVVAGHDLFVGFPEVHRGLVPALVMTLLRRQIAERNLRELLLLGQLINAEQAMRIGLVNRIVPAGSEVDEGLELARSVLRSAPDAVVTTKQLLNQLWPRSLRDDLAMALDQHLAARKSVEAHEGIAAFLQKRSPKWASRHAERNEE